MTNYLWVEKYRPLTLDTYIGNDHLKSKVRVYLESGDLPHLLFFGKAGTGKTTLAKILVKNSDVTFATFQIAKEGLDVAELDTLIFATPFKSWGSFQQGKGRVERQFDNKKSPLVLVIDDIYLGAATSMCRSLKRGITQHGLQFKTVEG